MGVSTVEQAAALDHIGNVVLFAGPGSGKTRTLVERAARALLYSPTRFRGVACITYTNAAANEIVGRLGRRGLHVDHVFAGTVHSFCLQEIIIPARRLLGMAAPVPQLVSEQRASQLLQLGYDSQGIADINPQYRGGEVVKIRRALFLNEDMSQFDDREVAAVREFESYLLADGAVDYESILQNAVHLLRAEPASAARLNRRFASVLVDEYQDLGGVLHELVCTLASTTDIELFCVGDPNQSIFGFAGANPKFMKELADRTDFKRFDLTWNFRSHPDIVDATGAIFTRDVDRAIAKSKLGAGAVKLLAVDGWLDAHAAAVADILEAGVANGSELGSYAVLYPRRGNLVDLMEEEFARRNLSYVFEKQQGLPDGPVADFVRACASKATLRDVLDRKGATHNLNSVALHNWRTLSYDELGRRYARLSGAAFGRTELSRFQTLRRLATVNGRKSAGLSGSAWLNRLVDEFRLDVIASSSDDPRDFDALSKLRKHSTFKSDSIADLADGSLDGNSFVLTTFHTSKGREFDNVIIPGLVNGTVPGDVKVNGAWGTPYGEDLEEARRGFYVAMSRARSSVALVAGTIGGPEWKKSRRGVSVFLQSR